MRLGVALLLGLLGAGLVQAEERVAPALRYDPFARPDHAGAARRGGSGSAWSPELRATLVAGRNSIANLGGTIVGIGEETHGYRLVEVREREAVFERNGAKLVLAIDPPGSPDE